MGNYEKKMPLNDIKSDRPQFGFYQGGFTSPLGVTFGTINRGNVRRLSRL
jgi:hypothetical protein